MERGWCRIQGHPWPRSKFTAKLCYTDLKQKCWEARGRKHLARIIIVEQPALLLRLQCFFWAPVNRTASYNPNAALHCPCPYFVIMTPNDVCVLQRQWSHYSLLHVQPGCILFLSPNKNCLTGDSALFFTLTSDYGSWPPCLPTLFRTGLTERGM